MNLYALRKQAFDKLIKAGSHFDGSTVSDEMMDILLDALFDAQFVFPTEMRDWMVEMLQTARTMQRTQRHAIDAERRKDSGVTWTPQMDEQLDQLYDEVRDCRVKILEQLIGDALFERFEPFMQLPLQIETKAAPA